jgi:putative Holliday junction resolvase
MLNPNSRVLALDVGTKRIGVASASLAARIAAPLLTLKVSDEVLQDIDSIILAEDAVAVVVGLPRDINGNETAQTAHTRNFAHKLKQQTQVPIHFQDEALTSVKAQKELAVQSKKAAKSRNSDIDSLAATYILEDFLESGEL